MELVLPVLGHTGPPRLQAGLDGRLVEPLAVRRQPPPLLLLGGGVLRGLGQRHERRRRAQAGHGGQLGLEGLEAGEVGPEGHDPEVGLVAEGGRDQGLVAVALERLDGVEHPLGGAGLGGGPLPVDRVEEVENPPALRRRHGVHAEGGYPEPAPRLGRGGAAARSPDTAGVGRSPGE